ncbi:MAG: DUF2071 domain-containing protein [Anaerolineales bacterium]|nr:DUF2071 domain-containing protein [Anaerolineales bacterium]
MFSDEPRPWPAPNGRWLVRFSWENLLFMHWPVQIDALRERIPEPLEIDTYDGEAWIGVVPFEMNRIRSAYLPPIPGLAAFPELNVRTYVTFQGKPGVWFFSLDAPNRLAVRGARAVFHLPYFDAAMSCTIGSNHVAYSCSRIHRNAPAADFQSRYAQAGPRMEVLPGSIDEWLTFRYCLYAIDSKKRLCRGEIHHAPWQLYPAEAEVIVDTMVTSLGIRLPDIPPMLHFSKTIDAVSWKVTKIT